MEIAARTEIKRPRWNDKAEAAGENEAEEGESGTSAVYQSQPGSPKIPPLSSGLPVLFCICHHQERR